MSRSKKIQQLKQLRELQETITPAPSHKKQYRKNHRRYIEETNRAIKNTDNKFYQQFKRP